MRRLLSVAIALWAGSLCTVCGLVAPTLFAVLDRQSAGRAAAALFRIPAWLGLAFALVMLFAVRREPQAPRGTKALIVSTAAVPLLSELALAPMMSSARTANDMARFGMLHGLSAALFLLACAGSLVLLWRLSRRAG
jgi:hypothetical protein